MIERLAEVSELSRNTLLIGLTGFTKCIVPKFVGPFELIMNTEIQLDNDGDRNDNTKLLERVNNLTLLASDSFHYLNVYNQCNIPSNHWHSTTKGKGTCNNCGGEHYPPYCPEPRDKFRVKNAKEERTACRDGRGRGSGRGGGRQSELKKWIKSNDNKDRDRYYYGNGDQNRGNAWM